MSKDRAAPFKTDWEELRRNARASEPGPPHWPPNVRPLTIDGSSLLGVDENGHLHWDGHPVMVKRKLDLTRSQTALAWIVAVSGVVAAVATVVQAWAAVVALYRPGL